MDKSNIDQKLHLILAEGEGLKVEFKEKLSHIDREIVAMANSVGGSLYLGVDDNGKVVGIELSNKTKSQVQDIARSCDPSISIRLIEHHHEGILEVQIDEGTDKPYRCKEGFFLRMGPSSQKLKRDEIVQFMNDSGKLRFDETLNKTFDFERDFSEDALSEFLKLSSVSTELNPKDILISLGLAEEVGGQLLVNNAGVLFFAKDPQRFFPEAFVTAVRYTSYDRYSILDRKDFKGNPIQLFEETIAFLTRHMSVKAVIGQRTDGYLGQREDIYDYPIPALREAIINSIMHRDYNYDSSHIYIHMFPDRIEIENPGGLPHGLTMENISKRSVRRNRIISDLLHRAGFVEQVGSGFNRMRQALKENNNPDVEFNATNFFDLRFYIRSPKEELLELTERQRLLYKIIKERQLITKQEAARMLNVANDTALRDLRKLIDLGMVKVQGKGKGTAYQWVGD